MSEEFENVEEYLLKVVVVGDFGVGKSSIIKRYVNDVFEPRYKPSSGVDFLFKLIDIDESRSVRLQLWNIAGEEFYGSKTQVYLLVDLN
jgi:Ras-related protein Rab-32